MIQVFKILRGMDRLEPDIFFSVTGEHGTRGHKDKMFKRHSRLELRRNTFSHRVVTDWNQLSQATISATTLNIFKTRLDKEWHALKYIGP